MMENSVVVEDAWENHHSIYWEETTVLDHGRGQELLVVKDIQMIPSVLQLKWRTGSPWLLDHCDDEAGRSNPPNL